MKALFVTKMWKQFYNRNTCAWFAAGVALSAAVLALIKPLRTLIHTLPGALQVQQRRCAHPAGVWPRARALLTGTVTLLTTLPCAVVPEEGTSSEKNACLILYKQWKEGSKLLGNEIDTPCYGTALIKWTQILLSCISQITLLSSYTFKFYQFLFTQAINKL